MSENHFAKALHNFTMSAAAGDAIKHLTDKDFTLTQIKEQLTFPAPIGYIAGVMWDRLIETHKVLDAAGVSKGTVLFDNSVDKDKNEGEKVSKRTVPFDTEIVEHYDEYGRKSFLQVQKESPEEMIFSPEDYIVFDRSGQSSGISSDFAEYLPWPRHPVWVHVSLFQGQESSS